MSKTIKICHIDNKIIKKTYNFVGNNIEFRKEGTSKLIEEVKINNYIHHDDSIRRIKDKIILNCNLNVSMSELYLFMVTKNNINIEKVYNDLTQTDNDNLTKDLLCNYYLNIHEDSIFNKTDCGDLEDKVYTYDDVLNLDKINNNDEIEIMRTLGHKVVLKRNYNFVTNPFYFVTDKNIGSTTNFTTLQNNKLLFEFGELKDDTIYLCTAEDVLRISKDVGISEDYLLKIYFPELYITHNIKSLEDLLENRATLMGKDSDYLKKNNIEVYNQSINLLYDLYYGRKKELNYLAFGINKIQLTIHPLSKITLPLELLFKFVQSSNEIPLIKYNPGKGQENVYRLFVSEEVSENGKKIPKLYVENKFKKTKIQKLMSQIDNRKKVTYSIRELVNEEEIYIFCSFLENGDIELNIDFKSSYKDIEFINGFIKEKLNSLILININKILEQSGYNYNLFENIEEDYIEINNVEYHIKIKNNKKINLKKIIKCITNVFKLDTTNIESAKDEIVMNYKRVSNFDVMDSINAYITTQKMKNVLLTDIIEGLIENYKLSRAGAEEKYNTWMQNINFEADAFENKKVKILSNPGFKVVIKNRKELNEQEFLNISYLVIENINNLKYIRYLSIYIDSLFRLLFNRDNLNVEESEVNRLCKGNQQKDIVEKKEIQADIVERFKNDAFKDLVGMEESSEEEEEEEEEEELKKTKVVSKIKSKKEEEMEVDFSDIHISGQKNHFLLRLRKREPKLFLIKSQKSFKMYSRSCPWQHRQYPIILNQKEKEYIDERDKELGISSYDEHITYGSTKKKHHYICPRFWCLQDEKGKQRSLTFEQINNGECGGWDALIRKKSGKIPKGKKIFEFTDVKKHKEGVDTDNLLVYKPMYPSFQHGRDTHPDGLCVPCCNKSTRTYKDENEEVWEQIEKDKKIYYKNVKTGDEKNIESLPKSSTYKYMFKGNPLPKNAEIGPDGKIDLSKITDESGKKQIRPKPKPKQIKNYKKCNQKINEEVVEGEESEEKNKKKMKRVDNAPLLDAFPLTLGKLGYLPLILQKFIGYDSRKKCQKTLTDSRLKDDTWCLLRVGIEKNKYQSFLEIICFYYNEINNTNIYLKELKDEIFKRLNKKIFLTLQNGNLYKIFKNNEESKEEKSTAEKVNEAYERFKSYIYIKNEEINYEYLWDFISLPEREGGLFKNGCNLLILREPENDLLQKIELVCPTNLYSSQSFDISKPSLIMYTLNNYYEPIIRYKIKDKKKEKKIVFNINNLSIEAPELVKIIKIIVEKTMLGCKILKSKPIEYNEKYDFQSNITSYEIIKILGKIGLEVEKQVFNNNMKVVGLVVKKEENGKLYKVYIPTYPSAINIKLNAIEINDPNSQLGMEYDMTRELLKKIHELSGKKILCEPRIKIVNKHWIVGILTQTNQFVPVQPKPYQEPPPGWNDDKDPDGLKVIENNTDYYKDYFKNESMIMDKRVQNKKRILIIKKIKLESNFYNVFRNTLRIILNNNKTYRVELLKLIEDPTIYYAIKIKLISQKLLKLMIHHIEFTNFTDLDYEDLETVEKCFGLDEDSCMEGSRKKCCTFSKTTKKCKLFLPEINLINGRKNKEYYFLKMSDEILRYKKMRLFLFDKSTFFSFTEIHYNLNDREIILLEDLLLNEYFIDIKPYKKSDFINTKRLFDISKPIKGIDYRDSFKLEYEGKNKSKKVEKIEGKSKKVEKKMESKQEIMEEVEHIVDKECILNNPNFSIGNYWKKLGMDSKEFKILELKDSYDCVLEGLKIIIENFSKEKITKKEIKKSLITSYERLLSGEEGTKIFSKIWKNDNKIRLKRLFEKKTSLDTIIMSENYYITVSDIIAISKFYNIPLVLFSNRLMTCFNKSLRTVNMGDSLKDKVYLLFIGGKLCNKTPSRQVQPNYGIIQYKGNIEIEIDTIDWIIKELSQVDTFERYSKFTPREGKIKFVK